MSSNTELDNSQTTGTCVDADHEEVLKARTTGVTTVQEAIGEAIEGKTTCILPEGAKLSDVPCVTSITTGAMLKGDFTITASAIDWVRESKIEVIAKAAHDVNAS